MYERPQLQQLGSLRQLTQVGWAGIDGNPISFVVIDPECTVNCS